MSKCNCGSGLEKYPLFDARAIFVSYVCDTCEERIAGQYRSEIFTDPSYETCESIDPDE